MCHSSFSIHFLGILSWKFEFFFSCKKWVFLCFVFSQFDTIENSIKEGSE